MSVAKVIEIICEGKTVEDAINNGLKEVAKTVRQVKHVDVQHIHANVENNKIEGFRVICRFSFLHE